MKQSYGHVPELVEGDGVVDDTVISDTCSESFAGKGEEAVSGMVLKSRGERGQSGLPRHG